MGLIEKVKEKIEEVKHEAGERKRRRDVEKTAERITRERGDAEERAVGAIAKKHGLTRDRSVKGRYWINQQQYVDIDPRHPGTAAKMEKVISRQKEDIKIHTQKSAASPRIRSTAAQSDHGRSPATLMGDIGFQPRIHGKRPQSPTPNMPPTPGSFLGGSGFLTSPKKKGRR